MPPWETLYKMRDDQYVQQESRLVLEQYVLLKYSLVSTPSYMPFTHRQQQ